MRQPTFFLTHGAGPCFWVDLPMPFGRGAYDGLARHFEELLANLPVRPKAVLVVSAHWEAYAPTLSTAASPGMLFDYQGFPSQAYQLNYPAAGSPEVARRALQLLHASGIEAAENAERGYDHGVFVPMLKIDPAAELPVVMMSLDGRLDAEHHLAVGRAIAPLRDEGVLIIGSGSSYHGLRHIWDGQPTASIQFDDWLHDTVASDGPERRRRLADWTMAPSGMRCHPRPEHLLPLMVAAGAGLDEPGKGTFRELIGGKVYSCFRFGDA